MEEKNSLSPEQPEEVSGEPRYTPRPKWQIILAWVALVVFLVCVAFYYYNIMYKY